MKKRDIEFLYEMGTLRFIQRVWKQFINPDFANLAEHSLRVAWISLVIAKNENVNNTEKIIKMAIVHDVTESRTGDVHYLSRQYTKRYENEAAKDIFKNTVLEKEFINLWNEYEERKSIEAKIVKDADNIDVDLELREQEVSGNLLAKRWSKMRKTAVRQKLFTLTAKKMQDLLYKSDPHDWHINAPNRYVAGDWNSKNNK